MHQLASFQPEISVANGYYVEVKNRIDKGIQRNLEQQQSGVLEQKTVYKPRADVGCVE